MEIVFNVNPLGMEGLGATLTSLIRNCSSDKDLKLWFLCSELKKRDKNNLRQLLRDERFKGSVEFIDFDAKQKFGHLRSLHGDWTTYGRLLIPDIVKSDVALYLDSDLIINTDILELNNFTTDKILSAVYGSKVISSLENLFFIQKLKWQPDTAYFNAGVLLFNILAWQANNIDERIKEIADQYPNEIISHDQTLLNAICKGDFAYLPEKFNVAWYPGEPQAINVDKAIIHFVGSPKPWDLFGKIIHMGYNTWKIHNTPFWESQYGSITAGKLKRTWKIRMSILRHLKKRLTS